MNKNFKNKETMKKKVATINAELVNHQIKAIIKQNWPNFFILANVLTQIIVLSYLAIAFLFAISNLSYIKESSIIIGFFAVIIYILISSLYIKLKYGHNGHESRIIYKISSFIIVFSNIMAFIIYGVLSIISLSTSYIYTWPFLQPFFVYNFIFSTCALTGHLQLTLKYIKKRKSKQLQREKPINNNNNNKQIDIKSKRKSILVLEIKKLTKNKLAIICFIILIVEFGIIAPLWNKSFFEKVQINLKSLDFSNFKVSFWGGIGPSNYLSLNDSILNILGENGLNTTFYSTIGFNYFTDNASKQQLVNMCNDLRPYGISFIPHPPVGDFPDDYNAYIWISNEYQMISTIKEQGISDVIKGIVVDVERSHRYRSDMEEFKNNSALIQFINDKFGESMGNAIGNALYGICSANKTFHQEVVENISSLINYAHEELGEYFEMVLTCQGAGLYDLADGDADVQLFEQYSTYPPEWDINSWMFYTWGTYAETRRYKLAHNIRAQVSYFPAEKSRVLLGEVGKLAYTGDEGWKNFIYDLYICCYYGIKEVILYSYSYFIAEFGYEGLTELASIIRNKTSYMEPFEIKSDFDSSISALGTTLGDIIFNLGKISVGLIIIIADLSTTIIWNYSVISKRNCKIYKSK
ncbi:MAG: hypothetical protein ACTSRZ_02155 [Promethearchaeota archaeon]